MPKGKKIKPWFWVDFEDDMRMMADWAKQHNFRNVYGIPRGGLAIAVRLSHMLKIPIILDSYGISEDTLVVDDIADSGRTLKHLKKLCNKEFKSATMFMDENCKERPDRFLHMKYENEWVVFPWETRETSKYDGTLEKESEEKNTLG